MTKRILLIILFFCSVCLGQWSGVKPPLGTQLDRSHPLGNPVAAYFMLEGGGSKIYDLSGNGNTGSFVGNTAWVPGKFGSCLSFDGVGDYIASAATPTLKIVEGTLSVWAKTSVPGLYLLTVGSGGNRVFITMTGGGAIRGQALIGWSTIFQINTPTGALHDGKWHHSVLTWNSSEAVFYVDGRREISESGDERWNNTANVAAQIGADGSGTTNWNGSIDNVMIFNRALTASEIVQLYREPFCMFQQETPWLYVTAAAEEEETQVIMVATIARYSPFVILIGLAYICTRRQLGRERRYGKK